MSTHTRERFLAKLESHYGTCLLESAKFGDTSYGKIATDLCISPSQFSKLTAGTATPGMYERSTRNVDQLIELAAARESLAGLRASADARVPANAAFSRPKRLLTALGGVALLIATYWVYLSGSPTSAHPLAAFFDRSYSDNYLSPYLAPDDLAEFCPCAAYEGEWELADEYVIPLPGHRPGLYYRAVAADVRMMCAHAVADSLRGRLLYSFQYLEHELWIDRLRRPLSPAYFDPVSETFTEAYFAIDFEGDPDFVKLAELRSTFLDHLAIHPDSIVRHGEPTGRFAEHVDQALADEYELDPREVLKDVLGNMTSTDCDPAGNPYCDPNALTEGESELGFDCRFTIDNENLGVAGGYPYRKSLRLVHQNYVDRLPCGCESQVARVSDFADKPL